MKAERELFLEWLNNKYSDFNTFDITFNEIENCFNHMPTQARWEAWCASSSREGCRLVPCEPNQKQIDAGVYAVDLVSNDSIQVVNVYKAMIGSADE